MPNNFWSPDFWSLLVTMTILLAGMYLANSLCKRVKVLRELMIPSAVLGGFFVLLFDNLMKWIFHFSFFDQWTLEALTYHGLGLGFAAIALKQDDGQKEQKKKTRKRVMQYALTVVSTYLLQGLFGLAVSLLLSKVFTDIYPVSGLLLPMGYGQGPGQAYNWGHNYEMRGFLHGTSFGLAVAAMGFVSASIGGIIYLALKRQKGEIAPPDLSGESSAHTIADPLSHAAHHAEEEIGASDSLDRMTVQVSLVFISYIGAYLMMLAINFLIERGVFGAFGYNTLQPLIWGFQFLFATISATLMQKLLAALRKKEYVKRRYTDDFLQMRISGFMFDLMVVASIAAINLSAFRVRSFILLLTILSVGGGILTYWYCDLVAKRVFPDLRHETFLGLYGMLTGTNSTGIILLRQVDPGFRTPVARYMVYQVLYASLFGFPIMFLLGYAPNGMTAAWVSLAAITVLFLLMSGILLRKPKIAKE